MISEQHPLCAFDSSLRLFIVVSTRSDNRLKVYDIASGHLRYPPLITETKLGYPINYSCLALQNINTQNLGIEYCCLGTEEGLIAVWDLKQGNLLNWLGTEGDRHLSKINDIKFSYSSKSKSSSHKLFSTGEDKYIILWDLIACSSLLKLEVGENSVSRLVCLSGQTERIIAASSKIRLLNYVSKKTLHSYSGHSSKVTCLVITEDGKYLISGCNDRYISIWPIIDNGKKVKNCTCVLDSSPLKVETFYNVSHNNYLVCVVSSKNSLRIFEFKDLSKTLLNPICVISLSSESSFIENAIFTSNGLIVSLFSKGIPSFQTVDRVDLISKDNITLVVSEEETGLLNSENSESISERIKRRKRRAIISSEKLSYVCDHGDSIVSTPTNFNLIDGEQINKDVALSDKDVALSDRLKTLLSPSYDKDKNKKISMKKNRDSISESSIVTNADALAVTLTQSLQSKDYQLLDYCVTNKNKQTISLSLSKLPLQCIIPFLTYLSSQLNEFPQRSGTLLPWIEELLITHISFLLTVPNLSDHLYSLAQTVEQRIIVFPKILRLSGRLDMLLKTFTPSP